MYVDLLKAALTLVIGFLLKMAFAAIGFDIDPVLFNTLVAAIVVWILTQLGLELTLRGVYAVRRAFKRNKYNKS